MKGVTILDNFTIKKKLWLIYLLCVLIPLLISNSVVLTVVRINAEQEQRNQLQNSADRLQYNLTAAMDGCVSVSNYLSTDRNLNEFLERTYRDPVDYYDHFNRLLQNNVIRYYYSSQFVYDVQIFADNPTMTNGGSFARIDAVCDEQWFKDFQDCDSDLLLYTYYDENRRFLPTIGPARTVSVIRRLDHFGKAGMEKILKIDINYNMVYRNVWNEKMDKRILVCNDDYILFDSAESNDNTFRPFLPVTTPSAGEFAMVKPCAMQAGVWDIRISADKIDLFSALVDFRLALALLILCNLFLPTVAILLVNKSFLVRVRLIEEHLQKVEQERFERIVCREGKDEIGDLIRTYNVMVVKIRELIEVVFRRNAEKQALELSKKQSELNALQSQVNPHFLFNVLESIRMRSLIKGEEETAGIIEELAALMRRSVHWETDFVTIEEEISFVKSYLNVQKYRFGERLLFSLVVPPVCCKMRIPKLAIVTFVENACVHGIEEKREGGTITVLVSTDGEQLFIEITDTGDGITEEKLAVLRAKIHGATAEKIRAEESIGILNAYTRLRMYYEDNIDFAIESQKGVGTKIQLRLPAWK
ncbi:MAG: sensor histidine kinase [Acetanaerobacterium sp.]